MNRKSVVAWLGLGTLTMGYSSPVLAIDTTTIYLEFAPGAIDAEPFARAGTICVDTPSGTVTLTELVPVLGCVPVLPRTSPAYVIDGPYKVALYGTKDGAAIASQLMTRAIVAYATGDDADVSVSSENAVIDVPDDEFFCQNHQQYIQVVGEPDVGCSHTAVPHDYDYDLLQAWAITKGSSDVLIAIIDTGVDWTHPDLGGPGLLPGVPDSLLYTYYQGGPISRNEDEEIGDASQDSIPVPGLPWVDDDNDGKIDEDSWNHSRTEAGEPEVRDGIVSSVSGYTITDSSASFSPEDSLVGLWLYGNAVSEFGTYGFAVDSIIAYTDTSITTAGIGIFKAIEDDGGPTLDWSSFALPGVPYKTGDLQNNDPEEDMETDEWGWKNDIPNDDDENGWVDDVIGWDFVDVDPALLAYPNTAEDYRHEDGDPRSLYDHGTANAAIIAATDNTDGFGIVGIAPGVKILATRAGYTYDKPVGCGGNGPVVEEDIADNADHFTRAIDYAIQEGASIINLSLGHDRNFPEAPLPVQDAAIRKALAKGILVVNGSGNKHRRLATGGGLHDLCAGQPDSSLCMVDVAGLQSSPGTPGTKWFQAGTEGATWGPWVDIASYARGVQTSGTPWDTTSCMIVQKAGGTRKGTSVSSPSVSAVAGLVWSAYPQWDAKAVRKKVVESVDDIYQVSWDPDLNEDYIGELGSGRLNAYKALTFYGDAWTSADTTWAGELWVSGDITVPAGVTLTIDPGTTVHVAQDDILSAGINPYEIQFNVAGNLIVGSAGGAPVVLSGFADSADSTWGPIVFTSTSATSRVEFYNVAFEGVGVVATKDTPTANRVQAIFDGCSFSGVNDGIAMFEMGEGDSLIVRNTALEGTGTGQDGVGIQVDGFLTDTDYGVVIGDGTVIDGFGIGIDALGTDGIVISDVSIDNCGIGISVGGQDGSAPVIGPDVDITDALTFGVLVDPQASGESATLKGVTITDSGLSGIYVDEGARVVFASPTTTVSGAGLHGVRLEDASDATDLQYLSISGSAGSGIRVVDCAPDIGAVTVTSSTSASIYCDNGQPSIDGATLNGSSTAVQSTSGSDPTVKNCTISNATNGINVDPYSEAFAGNGASYGNNAFSSISGYFAVNANTVQTLYMVGNCYNGQTSPKASKFWQIGTIVYLPGSCQ